MYYYAFERHGEESLQCLAFFFGILFIVEVGLLRVFGEDYRFVEADYIRKTIAFGYVSLPLRLLVPLIAGLAMVAAIYAFTSRTFLGRAILAVSQDPGALRLVGGNPVRVKEFAFGLSIATAVVAGALFDHYPTGRAVARPRIYRPRVRDLCARRHDEPWWHGAGLDHLGDR
jgi:branched-chain amino acid transport system permease protein